MSEEKELKLACLHQAGGDLDHAKALFDWVSGSVRATPASEAAEVSAPNQDKPEEPFNYRHPSKYGTDVPRRCYLEELTPEERAILDLVDTVEHLGAHPLLTTTVIQLMKAGESLADWVDIELRDRPISALSTRTDGEDEVLLDPNPETASPEFASEPLTTEEVTEAAPPLTIFGQHEELRAAGFVPVGDPDDDGPVEWERKQTESSSQASSTEAVIPEGFTKWEGGECPVDGSAIVDVILGSGTYGFHQKSRFANSLTWDHDGPFDPIIAYRIIEATAEAERTEVDSQSTEQDRVEPLPSGIQFRVDGGPLQTTGQEPAAFAPVNAIEEPETDALMWANGFEADVKARNEAEPEPEAKRPFWMFAKKEPA